MAVNKMQLRFVMRTATTNRGKGMKPGPALRKAWATSKVTWGAKTRTKKAGR